MEMKNLTKLGSDWYMVGGNNNNNSNNQPNNVENRSQQVTQINLKDCKVISDRLEFKEVLGVECRYGETLSKSIFEALDTGKFDTAINYHIKVNTLEAPNDGKVREFPPNVFIEALLVGALKFHCGEVHAFERKDTPMACGPMANAYNLHGGVARAFAGNAYTENGIAHAYADAGAHADGDGIAILWGINAHGYANGKDASVFSFAKETKMTVTNGGRAFSDVKGLVVAKGQNVYYPHPTGLNEAPKPWCNNGTYGCREFAEYLDRLDKLTTAGVADAAIILGSYKNAQLGQYICDPRYDNLRVHYLTRAYELGRKDAAHLLGEYYMQRDNLTYKDKNLWEALSWYSIAQAEMAQAPEKVQQQIDFIKKKLNIKEIEDTSSQQLTETESTGKDSSTETPKG